MDTHIQFGSTDVAGSLPTAASPSRARRVRILHAVSRLALGGTENGVLKIIEGLDEAYFEHSICAVRGIDEAFAARRNVATRAHCAGSGAVGFQFPLFRLARIIRQIRPHIVHTRNFGALEAIPAARLAGVPAVIHSEHGYELEILAGLPLRRRLLCRALYPMADVLLAVTNDLRSFHAKQSWLPAERFRVIYNGVDTGRFSPRPGAAPGIREELGIPANRLVIGSVGRLVAIKDYETILQAAEALREQGKDVHVLIVGAGPEHERLREHAASSCGLAGRVTFPGASDRVPELLRAMDVFVLSSICEGMSNTLLEAMASGLPVVATRTGGNPELVQDGDSGWLFAPRDVGTLVKILNRLTANADLRRRAGAAGRRLAVEEFSIGKMTQRYSDLYFELAARSGIWTRN